ncbi:hypothetical protein DRO69_02835 [Candidatus Bathyarchaeota archaeon]|nr:MAG: hypothetical protein DRO69_02835 [Candidatus Bathyarchaeota archaeon]
MFGWMQAFVEPFVEALGGVFWHDTAIYIIPPTTEPIYATYVPEPRTKVLIIGVTFGTPREYDPATGTFGPEVESMNIGIWHCLPPDELVYIVGEGPVSAGEVYERVKSGEQLYVASLVNGKMVASKIVAVDRHRARKLVRVTVGRNKTITVTANHPLLSVDEDLNVKWVFAGNLKKGDYVAMPKRLPTPGEKYSSDEMRFLGLIFGDGSVTRKTISFTNKDRKLIDDFVKLSMKVLNARPKIYSHNSGVLIASIPSVSAVNKLTNHYGFPISPKTHLPKVVWKSSYDGVEAFLKGFEEADAYVDDRGRVRLCVGEREELADKVVYLAVVAGLIPYKVKQKQNFPRRRHDYIYSVYYSKTNAYDPIPYVYKMLYKRFWSLSLISKSKVCTRRKRVVKAISVLEEAVGKMRSIVNMEVTWGKVTNVEEVEYDGEVIDIETETHNFVAGRYPFITHNSTRGKMDWHWDPFVKSILMTNPYPQLIWCDASKPYELLIVNNTSTTVAIDVTFWVIRFPKRTWCPVLGRYCDPEELWNKYMNGIVEFFVKQAKE